MLEDRDLSRRERRLRAKAAALEEAFAREADERRDRIAPRPQMPPEAPDKPRPTARPGGGPVVTHAKRLRAALGLTARASATDVFRRCDVLRERALAMRFAQELLLNDRRASGSLRADEANEVRAWLEEDPVTALAPLLKVKPNRKHH